MLILKEHDLAAIQLQIDEKIYVLSSYEVQIKPAKIIEQITKILTVGQVKFTIKKPDGTAHNHNGVGRIELEFGKTRLGKFVYLSAIGISDEDWPNYHIKLKVVSEAESPHSIVAAEIATEILRILKVSEDNFDSELGESRFSYDEIANDWVFRDLVLAFITNKTNNWNGAEDWAKRVLKVK